MSALRAIERKARRSLARVKITGFQPDLRLGVDTLFMAEPDNAALQFADSFHIYVRREGKHLVALCTELGAIVEGGTLNDIVKKSRDLIARRRSPRTAQGARLRIVVGG